MASLLAPPGAQGFLLAQICASIAGIKLTLEAPDADLKDIVLTVDGSKITSTAAIAKYMLENGPSGSALLSGNETAQVLAWVDKASQVEAAAAPWTLPLAAHASDADREAAKPQVEALLAELNGALASPYVLGSSLSLADLALSSALRGLWEDCLGADVRGAYPNVEKFMAAVCAESAVSSIAGALRPHGGQGWSVPASVAAQQGKKKKEKKDKDKGEGTPAPEEKKGDEELDPEKRAKKEAKLAEKAAKIAKAKAKEEAAKAKAEAAAAAAADKPKKSKDEDKKAQEEAEVQAALQRIQDTPRGAKKDVAGDMLKGYSPKIVESCWYSWWEECGFFKADENSDKPPYVIVIPPPNVTGALHIGHALTGAIEDCIIRYKRMMGFNALYVPGTDHAGIATQTVVEKKLQRERQITRHDLGRENFLAEVYKWVDEYGNRICDQIRRLGSSVDWSRKAFTMDENLSRAVLEAFVRLHSEGLIYRDNRLVNWCCKLRTAVSDIEVDYVDIPKRTMLSVPGYEQPVEFGVLTQFAYPLEDGSGEIVVATTRPETMLGDTAVAVHPEDPRYLHLHGKFVVHPLDGRRIPIICDAELVDMSFGTGAVKITPAHDPNDFNTGKKHGLEFINIFDDNGFINQNGGAFKGQPRFQARVTVVEALREKGLFRGTQDNPMRLGLCSRSKDVIEPVLKPQWWVDCKDMAAQACAAVRDGRLEILPREFEATWFRWLENIRDWCISRQLWWGHRIPAWYITLDEEPEGERGRPGAPSERMDRWVVGRTEAEALEAARARFPGQSVSLHQDEDVLDTWFSSGLFPFSVFQWPSPTKSLERFYPNALLETGHDILFFWVARMVMMGMKLTGEVPFKQVYLHSMVRDAHGRKMSKSLGNVIDPLHVIEGISLEALHQTLYSGNLDAKEIEKAKAGQKEDFPEGIEECGTDALRFALVAYTSQARDINLDIKRVVAYRYWCNKLWNATKFAMMNIPREFVPSLPAALDFAAMPFCCRWVLSCLSRASEVTIKAMDEFNFSAATTAVYDFWQYRLCDVFIELTKPIMQGQDEAAKRAVQETLWICLDAGLRLLHPFMPFVTEELWQRLPRRADQTAPSVMLADYPRPVPQWASPELEDRMRYVEDLVGKVRSLRNQYGLAKQRPHLYVVSSDPARAALVAATTVEISTLGSCADVSVVDKATVPPGCGVMIVDEATTVYMLLKGVLDPAAEIQKLDKKGGELQGRRDQLAKKMATQTYLDKTPEAVKQADADKLAKMDAELEQVNKARADFEQLARDMA